MSLLSNKIIKEELSYFVKSIINEGILHNNIELAKEYLYDYYDFYDIKAMKIIGIVKAKIPNSRLAKCRYMKGVVRMYMTKQLDTYEKQLCLNKCLDYIVNVEKCDGYDSNLNNLSVDKLFSELSGYILTDLTDRKEQLSLSYPSNNNKTSNYNIVGITSFKEASQYKQYTDWCICSSEDSFIENTKDDICKFYFCLKSDFEKVQKVKGLNSPLDEYGLSMIAVSVDDKGDMNTCTCRWNHENGGNDNIMNEKTLSEILNVNFYETFKPYTEKEIKSKEGKIIDSVKENVLDDVQISIRNNLSNDNYCKVYFNDGIDIDDIGRYNDSELLKNINYVIFDMSKYNDKFDYKALVEYDKNENKIKPIINELFDDIIVFNGTDELIMTRKRKCNIFDIKTKTYKSEKWFDDIKNYNGIFASVKDGEEYYFFNFKINKRINMSSFDEMPVDMYGSNSFSNRYYLVSINSRKNVYSIHENIFMLDDFYEKIERFDSLLACKKEKQYTLYDRDFEKITDNVVSKLVGYHGKYHYIFKTNMGYYVYSFKDKKVYNFDNNKKMILDEVDLT